MLSRNRRLLGYSTAINALGNGAYLPFSLLLMAGLTGLPLTTVGLTMTVAALVALGSMPAMGALIDRTGSRPALVTAHLLRASAFAVLPVVHHLVAFALVAGFSGITERMARIAQPALIGETATGGDADRLVALTRSLNNAGMGLGGLVAAVLAGSRAPWLYTGAAWLNAATFVVAAGMVAAIRSSRSVPQEPTLEPAVIPATYGRVLRDRSFRLLVTSTGLAAFGYSALTIFLPLYALRLATPSWTSGALFSLNTALCALAGVPVAAAATRRAGRATVAQWGLALMATGFAAIAMVATLPASAGALALVGLAVGIVVYSVGELLHAPMSTALALAQTAPELRGRSMAINQMAWGLAAALSPALFTTLLGWHLLSTPILLIALDAAAIAALAGLRRQPHDQPAAPLPGSAPARTAG